MTIESLTGPLRVLREGKPERVRRIRDLTGLLEAPGALARAESALLAMPAFASQYAQRAVTQRAPVVASGPPSGSLGAVQREFCAWYGLGPSFLPVPSDAYSRPLEFAVDVLVRDHDTYHALCEYETSDCDEVALHSFLCAQAPIVFAAFVAALTRRPELQADPYKHLRDVLDHELDRAALARGRRARSLFAEDLASLEREPVMSLRRKLAIEPRRLYGRPHELTNTCGGKRVPPFFHPTLDRARH